MDDGRYVELLSPYDRIGSPWLIQQGLVPQSDDGVIIVRGTVDGHDVVGIAIEPKYEGGSIGEVGGAKIATALRLATESCHEGKIVSAVLLLESGGVRLQEATLGLAAISEIHSSIIDLRQVAPVIAVISGPIGCFGGMSLAAALCTLIIATSHGRLGMNGAEVIEQEAGPEELDASDRDLIWELVGCESRFRAGYIDVLVEDSAEALSKAIHVALSFFPREPLRLANAGDRLMALRSDFSRAGTLRNGDAGVKE
jgi:malonate decarboxylase beta subunit